MTDERKTHVLIVEDDEMNARLFEVVLTRLGGFEVSITEDADDVLRRSRAREPDVIIMDVSLTNSRLDGKPINGLELSRRLKDDEECRVVPIILATAHALEGDRERFLSESGADDYIAKPVTDHEFLIEKVRKHAIWKDSSSTEEQTDEEVCSTVT